LIQKILLAWFGKNKRKLPWRQKRSWYKTFLSEVILQQTTVAQGLPYFQKFLKTYPDICSLANADEQDILHLWAGLGYYSRARNMLKAAKIICEKHDCQFPQDYKTALALPGIGPYSASAILSIAFNLPYAVVDGNVIRVICRLKAIKGDTRDPSILKSIKKHANSFLDKSNPGDFNEAMMELGATICSPRQPQCTSCPLKNFCEAYKKNLTNSIPFKSKPAPKKKKYNIVGVIKNNSEICIVRRSGSGFLAGMWEFPVIEVEKVEKNTSQLFKKLYTIEALNGVESPEMRQIYSHIDLTFKAIVFKTTVKTIKQNKYTELKWVKLEETKHYAIHNAHKKIIEWLKDDY